MRRGSQQVAVALAHQAALGHNEKQEIEFRVRDYAALQRRMKSLDFTPRVPAGEQQVDGRQVAIWREKGLVMVLTEPLA